MLPVTHAGREGRRFDCHVKKSALHRHLFEAGWSVLVMQTQPLGVTPSVEAEVTVTLALAIALTLHLHLTLHLTLYFTFHLHLNLSLALAIILNITLP